MPPVLLHADTSGMMSLVGTPMLAAILALAVTILTVVFYGWQGGVAAAAVGAVFLAGGMFGDLLVHGSQDSERAQLTARMMMMPDPMSASRLHVLEEAEKGNRWHVVAVAGEGLLVSGLAAACFLLWRRNRTDARVDLMVGALERAAAWPMGPAAPPLSWGHAATAQEPALSQGYHRAAS
jgi:hypothetical protein